MYHGRVRSLGVDGYTVGCALLLTGCSLAPWTFVPRDGAATDAAALDGAAPLDGAMLHDAGVPEGDAGPPGRPRIISTSPAGDERGVEVHVEITIQFSEEMDPASIDASTVTLMDAAPVAVDVSYADRTVTIRPAARLDHEQEHTVTVAASVRGTSGVTLGEAYSFAFTTRAERAFEPELRVQPEGGGEGDTPRAWMAEDGEATVVFGMQGTLHASSGRGEPFAMPIQIARNLDEAFAIDGNARGDVAVVFDAGGEIYVAVRRSGSWTGPHFVAVAGDFREGARRGSLDVALDRAGVVHAAWCATDVPEVRASRGEADVYSGAALLQASPPEEADSAAIASEASGFAAAVWIEQGEPWVAVLGAAGAWLPAERLEDFPDDGIATSLTIRADAAGGFTAAWLQRVTSVGERAWLARSVPGVGWSDPAELGGVSLSASPAPSVALDVSARGHLTVLVRQGGSMPLLARSAAPGEALGAARTVVDDGGDEVRVAVDDYGGAVAVWRDGTALHRGRLRPGASAWTSERFATGVSAFDVAGNARGDVVIVWTRYETVGGDHVYASFLR